MHLITRAQGGIHDYAAFLHEAGHALHYAGSTDTLPYTYRAVSRDHALTEIYSYIVEAISREPGWHERYFAALGRAGGENAEAASFVELLLFRRYEAKLRFELEFWSVPDGDGMPDRYTELLTAAAGVRYRPGNYLADMDAGFYSADYLRAWIRSSQLRQYLTSEIGADWWCESAHGRLPARPVGRRHAPDQRGDRRPPRVRPARHRPARQPARRRGGGAHGRRRIARGVSLSATEKSSQPSEAASLSCCDQALESPVRSSVWYSHAGAGLPARARAGCPPVRRRTAAAPHHRHLDPELAQRPARRGRPSTPPGR